MIQNIIDTHLHLWDVNHLNYSWLADVPKISDSHLLADLHKDTEGISIDKFVFVQCEADYSQYLDEAKWVQKQAEKDTRIQGIVAWAPLEKGDDCRAELDALKAIPLGNSQKHNYPIQVP